MPALAGEMEDCVLLGRKIGLAQPRGPHKCWPRNSARTARTLDDAVASAGTRFVGQRCESVEDREVRQQLCLWLHEVAVHVDPRNRV